MKKITLFSLIVIALTITILSINTNVYANTKLYLNRDSLILFADETYDINIHNKQAKSIYNWYSDDENIAKVNNKNGLVEAINVGDCVVYCDIKNNNKIITLKCDIKVIEKPPLFNNELMAHAFGGFEGNKYSNTLEAFYNSIFNDFTFVETDIILTSDNKLVAFHNWDEATYKHVGLTYDKDNPMMDYDTFKKSKIHDKYNTIDIYDVVELMKICPNVYFEFDIKAQDYETAKLTTQIIVDACGNNEDILDRILMQFISRDAFYGMNSIYKFKYYQYFTYKSDLEDVNDLISFCKDNNITSVAIKEKYITKSNIKQFKSNGICVLGFTVDDEIVAKKLLDYGVDTICTNFLNPQDF